MADAPGWYLDSTDPSKERHWDGERWGETRPVQSPRPAAPGGGAAQRTQAIQVVKLDAPSTVLLVAFGMVVGWFLIWLGAQAAPDVFYWPIKVVVENSPFQR